MALTISLFISVVKLKSLFLCVTNQQQHAAASQVDLKPLGHVTNQQLYWLLMLESGNTHLVGGSITVPSTYRQTGF